MRQTSPAPPEIVRIVIESNAWALHNESSTVNSCILLVTAVPGATPTRSDLHLG